MPGLLLLADASGARTLGPPKRPLFAASQHHAMRRPSSPRLSFSSTTGYVVGAEEAFPTSGNNPLEAAKYEDDLKN